MVLAALRRGVAMLVLGVMPIGLAAWSRFGKVTAQEAKERHTREQTHEPTAVAASDEGTRKAVKRGSIHVTALLSGIARSRRVRWLSCAEG